MAKLQIVFGNFKVTVYINNLQLFFYVSGLEGVERDCICSHRRLPGKWK